MEHKKTVHPEQSSSLSGFFLGLLLGILLGMFLGSKKGKQLLRMLTDEGVDRLSKLEEFLENRALQKNVEEKEDDEPSGNDYVKDPVKDVVIATEEMEFIEPVKEEFPSASPHTEKKEELEVKQTAEVHKEVKKELSVEVKKEPEKEKISESNGNIHTNGVHKKPSTVRRFFRGAKRS